MDQKLNQFYINRRLAQCKTCPNNQLGTCRGCGCIIAALVAWPWGVCPLKRW